MENQPTTLDELLTTIETDAEEILAAGTQTVELPTEEEQWWPQLIDQFGSVEGIFARLGLDRGVFDQALALVSDVVGERRGRKSAIRTNREKLLFLMIYMSKGVEVLELLVSRFIRTREHVMERAKTYAALFRDNIVEGAVRHFDETHASAPGSSLVVDCTVCPIRRPKQSFKDAKVFFSGKHWFYALKKEVCVNIRSGTAALISPEFPGSVHDIMILRSHIDAINETLQGRSMLADLGYRGAEHDVPTLIVCGPEDTELRSRRVLVECFFGRLKTLWRIFSKVWTLDEQYFDLFFDIACGLTNMHILAGHPLQEIDSIFNMGVLNKIKLACKKRQDKKKLANARYRRKRAIRLGLPVPPLAAQEP